jgi:hypothetical protein
VFQDGGDSDAPPECGSELPFDKAGAMDIERFRNCDAPPPDREAVDDKE